MSTGIIASRALSSVFILCMMPPVAAEPAPAENNHDDALENIIVTSPRVAPGQISFDTDEAAAGRETGEILRDVVGVSGSRIGGHGTDPVIRGLGQNRINVLLDGAFVLGACPNRMDPPTAYAAASSYDRITVLRGITTLEYGGGPGGTVLIERNHEGFQAGESLRIGLDMGYRGNSGTREGAADVAAGNQQGFLRLIGGWMDADDYEDGGGNPVRSAFEERSGSLIAGWTPDADTRLIISAEAQRLRDELFAGAGMDSPLSDNDTLRVNYQTVDVGMLTSLKLETFISRVDHVMDNYSLREPPSSMMKLRVPASSETAGGRLVLESESVLGRWRYGISIQNNKRDAIRVNDSNDTLNSLLWPDAGIDQSGAFAELIRRIGSNRRLTAGLRFDRVRARASSADRQPAGMLLSPNALYALYYGEQADGRTRRENLWGGFLRVEHDLADGRGSLYGALSRTLRTADATERYLASNAPTPSRRWVGNPLLDPEAHHQLEIGLLLGRSQWNLEGSLFYADITDFILRDRANLPDNNATVYRNVDSTRWGGELSGRFRFARSWEASLGLAYVRATNTDDDRPIAQTPPLEAQIGLNYRVDDWELGLIWRAAARQRRVDDDPLNGSGLDAGRTPGWSVVGIHGRYAIATHWQLDAGIDNLFDRAYAQHLNRSSAFDADQIQVNEPGRSAWIRVRYRFD
jgi:iron complex outermembrane receptor protein